ncbi:MAG: hypothetical protein JWM84_2084 [Nocardioides sp.]|nr:hypothetical protein [Nocardioides sp.]
MWGDFADDYINYAADHLNRWGDGIDVSEFMNYDKWLVKTDRRELPGSNRASA